MSLAMSVRPDRMKLPPPTADMDLGEIDTRQNNACRHNALKTNVRLRIAYSEQRSCVTPIHLNGFAGDEAGKVGRKKGDRCCQFFRAPCPLERYSADPVVNVMNSVIGRRYDHGGSNRIDRDAMLGHFH